MGSVCLSLLHAVLASAAKHASSDSGKKDTGMQQHSAFLINSSAPRGRCPPAHLNLGMWKNSRLETTITAAARMQVTEQYSSARPILCNGWRARWWQSACMVGRTWAQVSDSVAQAERGSTSVWGDRCGACCLP